MRPSNFTFQHMTGSKVKNWWRKFGEWRLLRANTNTASHGGWSRRCVGGKDPKRGRWKETPLKERVTSWLTHFRNLLCTHQDVEGTMGEIPAVLGDIRIDDGPFSTKEYVKVKASLRLGKSAGPDGIPP